MSRPAQRPPGGKWLPELIDISNVNAATHIEAWVRSLNFTVQRLTHLSNRNELLLHGRNGRIVVSIRSGLQDVIPPGRRWRHHLEKTLRTIPIKSWYTPKDRCFKQFVRLWILIRKILMLQINYVTFIKTKFLLCLFFARKYPTSILTSLIKFHSPHY